MIKVKLFFATLLALFSTAFLVMMIMSLIYQPSVTNILIISLSAYFFSLIFGFYILNSKRTTHTKTCWLFVFLLIPLFGPVLFLIFGVTPFRKKTWKARTIQEKILLKYEDFSYTKQKVLSEDANEYDVFKLGYVHSSRPLYQNNNIKLIPNNGALYTQYIDLIRSAKKNINLQTYILTDGFFLRSVFAELIIKARQGIKVRIMYDWVGSRKRFNKNQIKELKQNGIEVAIFNPKGLNKFRGITNFRGHRKVLIIDNQIALFGGSNIGDEYLSMLDSYCSWEDKNIILKGETVNTLNILFCNDWLTFSNKRKNKNSITEMILNLETILEKNDLNIKTNAEVQAFESNPDSYARILKSTIINNIYNSKKSIRITTPYFMPTDDIIDALISAKSRGVDIQILAPGKNDDKTFIKLSNRSKYFSLTQIGVKIYEFEGFIHSKYMIFDDDKILFGTFNLDFRSLYLNFESILFIKSLEIAKNFNNDFENNKSHSRFITSEIIKKEHKLYDYIRSWLLSIIYPLL